MSDLILTPTWTPAIYELALTDPVKGGPDGVDNLQAKQLGNRTEWLKQRVDWTEPAAFTMPAAASAHATIATVQCVLNRGYHIEIEILRVFPGGNQLWIWQSLFTYSGGGGGSVSTESQPLGQSANAIDLFVTDDAVPGGLALVKARMASGGAFSACYLRLQVKRVIQL